MQIPVDVSKMQMLVVGVPTPQMTNGQPRLDRETQRPLWNVDVTMIFEWGAVTERLAIPEGGFPKEMGIGTHLDPNTLTVTNWERKDGRTWMAWHARSVKVVGGSAGVKAAA